MANMYGNFVWWQGVVEDNRLDPLYLGRCKVRILGYHTDNIDEIPTEDLPWATIMQPTTSAAMSGIGTTPTGPVNGTWVIGFFRDGEDAQEPVIMGTIGGIPEEGPNPAKGFNDPEGKYPLNEYVRRYKTLPDGSEDYDETDGTRKVDKFGEPDTNRLARGKLTMPLGTENGENHASLAWKRESRQMSVAKALAGSMWDSSTGKGTIPDAGDVFYWGDGDTDDVNYYWNEPNPRYGGTEYSDDEFKSKASSAYPLNHVRQSEAGHVEEWDDTPTAERLHRYHSSGTFEEIQADGTRVVKVQGEDYEIACEGKNVLVKGECNITVTGNCRLLTKGNLTQQVYGDYHLNVGGDMRVKVGKSMAQEILDQRKIKVGKNDDLTVGVSQLHTIAKNCTINVGNNYAQAARDGQWSAIAPTVSITGTTGCTVMGIYTCDIMGATVGLASALLTKIESDVAINIFAATELITITGPIIETSATKMSTAAGFWSRTALNINDAAVAHNCLDAAVFNVKAPFIMLN